MFFKKGTAILCLLLGLSPAMAEEKKPCLIFSGDAGTDYAVDLMQFNRIAFGETAMTLSSSDNAGATLELLYSAYNRFKIDDAEPTQSSIDEIATDASAQLTYSKAGEQLMLSAENADDTYSIGVFNLSGALILSGELRAGESLSVSSLAPGAYVAIAVGRNFTQSLKFVK